MTDKKDLSHDGDHDFDEALQHAQELPKAAPPKKRRQQPSGATIIDAHHKLHAALDAANLDRDRAAQERKKAAADANRAKDAASKHAKRNQELADKEAELTRRLIETEREQVAKQDALLEGFYTTLAELRGQIDALAEQRAERLAKVGAEEYEMASSHAQRLADLDKEAEEYRRKLESAALEDARRTRTAAETDAERLRRETRGALDELEKRWQDEFETAKIKEIEVDQQKRELDRRAKLLDKGDAVRKKAAEEQVRQELQELNLRAERAEEARDHFHGLLAAAEERLDGFGSEEGKDASELLRENKELHRQLEAGRAELHRRPPEALRGEHEAVKRDLQAVNQELAQVRLEHSKLQQSDSKLDVLTERIIQREQMLAEMQEDRQILEGRIRDQREELELLNDAGSVEPPDADLVAIDEESRRLVHHDEGRPDDYLPTLAELAADVQRRMAAAGFFYSESHVRLFLAGLAGARIQILDGLSGTGKTSLPVQFCAAISGICEIVEVQAAWRDRLDLLGTYNAFDRRLYPTDFSKALYRASTPGWADAVTFVVLDEMNLAQPEHYFADALSALESGKLRLQLLPRPIGNAHELLDGQSLRIARNVWFVGTANLDETTQTIADKTYDRASLLELPTRYKRFKPPDDPLDTVRLTAGHLSSLFDDAEKSRRGVDDVLRTIDNGTLREATRRVRIDFGNRVDRIVRRFVPTLISAGGSSQEALDHLLATKLVRKLGYRYELKQAPFDLLRLALEDAAGTLTELPHTSYELERQRENFDLK